MSEREVQVRCPAGCHDGIGGYVSRDMAIDAGEPDMEGQPVPCGTCNGDGWIVEVVLAAQPPTEERRNEES